jgi:hypothetical protein
MAANKCSFTIYSKGQLPKEISEGSLSLSLYNQKIPIENNPKYLGINLDRRLNFMYHTEMIRKKAYRLLNILKCLSYKNWSLGIDEKLIVYKSLIRSTIEYAAPLLIINEKNIDRLQGVQYQALRIIYKENI